MKNILYVGNKLSKHGINVTSIETLGPLLEQSGFKVIYTSSVKNIFFRIIDMIFTLIFNVKRIDIVLIDTYSTSAYWYAVIISSLSKLFRIKYVLILRGGNLPSRLSSNPNSMNFILNNSICNCVPSKYLYTSFMNAGISKLTYIPNNLDIKQYDFKKREVFFPKILWVRAFEKIYNPEMAFRVFAGLKEKYSDASFCMIGPFKGISEQSVRDLSVKYEIEVEITGALKKSEWILKSTDYDIFINTTFVDNTPISVMEAMALGLPVISTNVGGIPYLLDDKNDAILVESNDVKQMVDSIVNIIENPSLGINLTLKARKKVEQFDWEIVKNQWKEILK